MAKRRRYYNGKRISKGELRVAKFLEKHNIQFNREQIFEGCLSKKNHSLRFDFYLQEYDLCIEVQGEHHYKPINKYRKAYYAHKRTVAHDQIKREYMANYSTTILEIPYWEMDNIEQLLEHHLLKGN